ncbi:hypothetical protein RHMOL_Rhmol06G0229400 [Rhododendron molle]|uniref:Uncharacterized protein n=1 Tax=Rhododendron molle TaxID=49168 RepID=A0ACC0NF65_RHOML|nr:hypothetical protein RHMOL_Rhmol06G0229400 [Rhododendron molle]
MDEVMTAADGQTTSSSPSSPAALLPLLSAFLAFALAQFLKLFTTWYKENRWDSKRLISSGGMPSSHSATVTALAFAIGLEEGTGGSPFAIAVVLACVVCTSKLGFILFYLFSTFWCCSGTRVYFVMYDATGVRLHAGRQAELLNQIVCEFPPEHPLSNSRPLRDSLGHTPLQVLAGAILGCVVAFLMKNST